MITTVLTFRSAIDVFRETAYALVL